MPLVLQQRPDARLLIIGDGDDRDRLQRLVRELSLSNAITFTGLVSHEDKVRYLNQLWLAVNPSPKEGWGLTVIEANACGAPVIAADSPGLRDSVLDRVTGRLYPYADIGQLSRLIGELIEDPSARREYGQQARAWASSFTWEASARKAMEILDKVIHP
jgi:glycosyltransferase involved in cell wall biosynthesis